MDLVKNGEADAFVTAGNTGAGMVTALFRLGRCAAWIARQSPRFSPPPPVPVLCSISAQTPTASRRICLQFAIMGSVYAEKVRGVHNPKVGLVSNGEEEGKGNELVRAATPFSRNPD